MATASLRSKLGLVKVSALGAGILVAIAAAPAHAANFAGSITNLRVAGFSTTVGDKIYSDFVISANFNGTDQVSIGDGGANHTISVQNAAGWDVGTYDFTYKVTVIGGNTFDQYAASSSSSIFNPTPAGSLTLSAGGVPNPISGTVNGGLIGPATYGVKPTFDTFTNQLIVTAGKVTSFDNTLTQTFDDNTRVPGPLPILGAGAAFGFSRKLRKRIKATV
jgi:hypothetical protein